MKRLLLLPLFLLLTVATVSACGPASPEAGDTQDSATEVSAEQANAVTCRPAFYCVDTATGVRRYFYVGGTVTPLQAQTTCTSFISNGTCRNTATGQCTYLGMAPVGCTLPK